MSKWKVVFLLLVSSFLSAQTPTTVTGTVQDATGVLATSGTVVFSLQPQNSGIIYFVTGTGIITPQVGTCGIDSSGNIKNLALTGACLVWGTDIIQPANLTYTVSFFPNGNQGNTVAQQCITGASYNLNSPTFCPVIKPTPQGATVITSPIQNNLIPSANGVFSIGSASLKYANGFFNNLNVGTCVGCTSPSGYQTIQSNAVSILQRTRLNFLPPLLCVDNPGNTSSDCSMPNPLFTSSGGTGVVSTAVYPTSGVVETGTGTTNTIPKFTNGAAGIQGNSSINDNGTTVSVAEPLQANANTASGNVGLKYPSADHVIFVSPNGSDSNDGLSPGTAKLTPQAAFNTATATGTVTGTVILAPGSYSCPTTFYSNLEVHSFSRNYPFANVTDWGFVDTQNGAIFSCVSASNVVIGPDVANLFLEGVGFNFGNAGGGLVLNSVAASRFEHVSVTLAGSSTQAAVEMKVNTSSGVQHNTTLNIFDDFNILANTGGVGSQANGLTLTGQGVVNSGTDVTDNRFTNLTIAGGLKSAIIFRLNTDTNVFNGVQVNNTGTAQGDVIVFNDLVPGSDQDADGMTLIAVASTGAFNHPISMGQSAGNNISISSAAEVVPNILGGTPSYIVTTIGLGGVPMGLAINGIIRFKSSNTGGSDVIQMANGTAAAPAYSFAENTNTGFWKRSTLNEVIFAANGVNILDFLAAGIRINGTTEGYTFASGDPSATAQDTGIWRGAAKQISVGSGTFGDTSGGVRAAAFIAGGTAATLTGTGACATFSGQAGGANAGRATCTGVTAASTFIITTGVTAPTGWICSAFDQTTRANLLQQTSTSTTACTLTATSITQNDVIVFTAMAF